MLKTLSLTLTALAFAAPALAQSATQTLNFEVQAISILEMAGSPVLTVNAATAGAATATPATAAATYAITNNQTNRKITAAIDTNMPAGMTLTSSLAAAGSGTSGGAKTLTTAATDVVTGIGPASASGLVVTYGLTVAATTAPTSGNRTVTYTIAAGS